MAKDQYDAKVSVIIPVYNTASHLDRCLLSVIKQNLQEIEILVIIDGSTDDSMEIIEKYADEDPRLYLFCQENKGLSVSRNIGIQHSNGEYIFFLDSDDTIDPETLNILYKTAKEKKADIVSFNIDASTDDEKLNKRVSELNDYYYRSNNYEDVYSGKDLLLSMQKNNDYVVNCCAFFYRSSFLTDNSLSFIGGILHEDNAFVFQALSRASRAIYCPSVYYHRRIRNQSITTQEASFNHSYGYYVSYKNNLDFLKKNDFDSDFILYEMDWLYSRTLYNSIKKYLELSDEEKIKYHDLPKDERMDFYQQVVLRAYEKKKMNNNGKQYKITSKIDLERKSNRFEKQGVVILVATHKDFMMPEDDRYLPIFCGAAISKLNLPIQRDDEGENISIKNPYYSELTAMYWAYRNLKADYIGLFHYRRYLDLKGLRINDYRIVLPKKRHYYIETIYDQYAHAHDSIGLDKAREVISEFYPNYLPFFDQHMQKRSEHSFNMFVMRYDIFIEYCDFLFDVLFKVENHLGEIARLYGYISERLLDVFINFKGYEYIETKVIETEKTNWPLKIFRFLQRKFKKR